MLNSDNEENFIEKLHYDSTGHVTGVQVKGETAGTGSATKKLVVIGDPSYWVGAKHEGTDKPFCKRSTEIGVARAILIMDHPIAKTSSADSCQIIIPGADCGRVHDMYICMSSFQHNVAAAGKYIAVCSATVQENDAKDDAKNWDPDQILAPCYALCGEFIKKFSWFSESWEQSDYSDSKTTGCYITKTYDATTHFATSITEILRIYQSITGEALDLTPTTEGEGDGATAGDEKEGKG